MLIKTFSKKYCALWAARNILIISDILNEDTWFITNIVINTYMQSMDLMPIFFYWNCYYKPPSKIFNSAWGNGYLE